MIKLGTHVDSHDPIAQAQGLEADICQFFLGDPQSYKKPATTHPGGAIALKAEAEAANIDCYIHAAYIINVASLNNRIRIPSRKLLQQTIDAAAEIGANGVIVHGGHVTKGDDPQDGFANWAKCVAGLELKVQLLIENTAGGANAMARRFDRLAQLWDALATTDQGDQIGLCLDTCHAFTGGNELGGIVERVTAITGRIDLIHGNNSRDTFDSGADRHAALNSGTIAPAELLEVFRSADCPVILETPTPTVAEDLHWLRQQL